MDIEPLAGEELLLDTRDFVRLVLYGFRFVDSVADEEKWRTLMPSARSMSRWRRCIEPPAAGVILLKVTAWISLPRSWCAVR